MHFTTTVVTGLSLLGSVTALAHRAPRANADLLSSETLSFAAQDALLEGPPANCWDPDNNDDTPCFAWSHAIQKHGLEANITELWNANPPEPIANFANFQVEKAASQAGKAGKSDQMAGSDPRCIPYQEKELLDCIKKKIACCTLAWTLVTIACCLVHCDSCDIV